ncbi:hypothetical protein [Corallococcus aberystwythensis]|nr:hypothetical protein [Corallococcus aberystwythensis]
MKLEDLVEQFAQNVVAQNEALFRLEEAAKGQGLVRSERSRH